MAANARSATSGDDSSAFFLLVIFGGSAVLCVLGWMSFHAEISTALANWALLQADLLGPLFPSLHSVGDAIRNADMAQATPLELWQMLQAVEAPLAVPAALIIGGLGILCFLRAAPAQFTRALDLDGLIAEQARWIRPLAPFCRRRLKLTPLLPDVVRPADPALHKEEWVARFALNKRGQFDEVAARNALALQLGDPWRGIGHASPLTQFLFAVFAVHLAQRREAAQKLLGDFAEALPASDRTGAAGPDAAYPFPRNLSAATQSIIADASIIQPASLLAAGHGFTTPALMALLTAARRRGGVLAPAQFVGLKLVDRSLWYALHSLGFEGETPGQTTHPNPRVEAIGARAHWEAERMLGQPIAVPSIDSALDAIRADMTDVSRNDFPREV